MQDPPLLFLMASSTPPDTWSAGDHYEPYVGRWSRLVAREFLQWLALSLGLDWLDAGCGTGALTQMILYQATPRLVVGVDASPAFVAHVQAHIAGPVRFEVADIQSLPLETASVDAAVSGLVLNFVPQPLQAVLEMARVTRPGGVVAAYVWDYAGRMEFMRIFWDAAAALDPAAGELDEGRRFPLCRPDALAALFAQAGLARIETRPIDIPTHFRDFDDYWTPFLGGQGPAPSYVVALDAAHRNALRDALRARLPIAADGAIRLVARAWAVRGEVRQH